MVAVMVFWHLTSITKKTKKMKTVTVNIYKFSELSEDAKQKAIDNYRSQGVDQFYYDEIIDSIKKLSDIFNLKFGRKYTDIRTGHIEDNILQLSGVRLYKYLINNYYVDLFRPKYIKCIDREIRCKQFICEVNKYKNGTISTFLYSKMKYDNSCVLTGVCYDDDILKPIYDFLNKPEKSVTFEDLIQDVECAIQKTFNDTEEWVNSEEYITEIIEANEYEFTEDGNRY
jgi:hypothetical protein